MLPSDEIIWHVKKCHDSIHKWSPSQYTYWLESCYIRTTGTTENSVFEENTHQLGTNPGYNRIPHLVILAPAVVSFLYQSIFEDTTVLEVSTYLLEAWLLAGCLEYAYAKHHICGPVNEFPNESMLFEKRRLDYFNSGEKSYWKNIHFEDYCTGYLYVPYLWTFKQHTTISNSNRRLRANMLLTHLTVRNIWGFK